MIETYGGYEAEPRGEECGVAGAFFMDPQFAEAGLVAGRGIKAIENRGQDAAGIAITTGSEVLVAVGGGPAHDVFPDDMSMLSIGTARAAIAHNRWSTVNNHDPTLSVAGAQPQLYFNDRYPSHPRISTAHNGEFTNTVELAEKFGISIDLFPSDSAFANYLIGSFVEEQGDLTEGVRMAAELLEGSFSLLVMDKEKMVAVRDEQGFRPLMLGEYPDGQGYAIGSEDAAIEAMGAIKLRDVEPGEIITIDQTNGLISEKFAESDRRMCLFEFIYFANAGGKIEGIDVEASRKRMGRKLAERHPIDVDLAIGVPDSGTPAAMGFAEAAGVPYRAGLLKNKESGRSFIQSGKANQEAAAAEKYIPVPEHLEGKRVVVVDDSLVNGTTVRQLVRQLKDAGVKEIHFRITSPPIKWPCFYGAAFKDRSRLVAALGPKEQDDLNIWLASRLGIDSIGYLSVEDTERAILESTNRDEDPKLKLGQFCTACFTRDYPVFISPSKKMRAVA